MLIRSFPSVTYIPEIRGQHIYIFIIEQRGPEGWLYLCEVADPRDSPWVYIILHDTNTISYLLQLFICYE